MQLLRDVYAQEKWVVLEESIKQNAKAFEDEGVKASIPSTV